LLRFGALIFIFNWVFSKIQFPAFDFWGLFNLIELFLDMKYAPFIWDSAVSFGSKSQMETIQKSHFFSLFDFVMCE
jgi:hypothetical protein